LYTAGNRPWVVQAATVASVVRGRTRFELPAGVRPASVEKARVVDQRVGYLGDWHSHPSDIGPSGTDLATMRRLARDTDGTANPLLLIARRRGAGRYQLDMREYARYRLFKTRIVAAGGLISPAPPKDILGVT
jgi:hypothetical protein